MGTRSFSKRPGRLSRGPDAGSGPRGRRNAPRPPARAFSAFGACSAPGLCHPATRGLGAWRDGDQISLVRAALGPRGGDRPAASCLSPSASILFRVRFPRNSSLERTCSSFASLENLVFVTLFARILSYVSE